MLKLLILGLVGTTLACVAADSNAGEWVIRKGGRIMVNGWREPISRLADLPRTEFRVTGVDLTGTVLDPKEFDRWPRPSYLNLDPTFVRGEQMRGSIKAVHGARSKNKTKSTRLTIAFGFFAAAIVSIVILASAVSIRLAEAHKASELRRDPPAAQREPARAPTGTGRAAIPGAGTG